MKLCVKSVRKLHISPYSVRLRENTDYNNSEYGHFSRSEEGGISETERQKCKSQSHINKPVKSL